MPALAYLGVRQPSGDCEVLALDAFDRPARHLAPRRDLADHSAGFNWGYPGSGPAQLALALLADQLGDDRLALALHEQFKTGFVARIDGPIWALRAADLIDLVFPAAARARPELAS